MKKIIDMNDCAPRCIECGCILLGLTELHCPECGTEFDPEYVKQDSYRVHLLPWERPEMGGWIKRLFGTFMLASLHPKQFYDSVSHRKDIRIHKPIKLIIAYILASIFICGSCFLFGEVISHARMWATMGDFPQDWNIHLRLYHMAVVRNLITPVVFILTPILSVAAMAVPIRLFFQKKLGRYVIMIWWRFMDIPFWHGQ